MGSICVLADWGDSHYRMDTEHKALNDNFAMPSLYKVVMLIFQ